MIVGRNPRNPVIGDTVLLRADNRRGVGTIVDTDAIRDNDGHDGSEGASAHDSNGFGGLEGMQMNLYIGDKVRVGTRVGTITDVGTILIEVKATDGSVRMVCPWELVRTRGR